MFPEYLGRWQGFSIRNIPAHHGSSSLAHRLSCALKECFSSGAGKAIAAFDAQLVRQYASNALATLDVDELLMDVGNCCVRHVLLVCCR